VLQHRKSDVVVRIQDWSGAPVAGASYKIDQVRAGFQWGVDINPTVAEQPAYTALLQSLFNQVQLWWSVPKAPIPLRSLCILLCSSRHVSFLCASFYAARLHHELSNIRFLQSRPFVV
jgi:hypothetical protein